MSVGFLSHRIVLKSLWWSSEMLYLLEISNKNDIFSLKKKKICIPSGFIATLYKFT
jgi:hypothetical protein